MRNLLMALMLPLTFCHPVNAEERGCLTSTMVATSMAENSPAELVRHFVGDDSTTFMEAFNSSPPETDWVADEVMVYSIDNNPAVYLFMFNEGCAFKRGTYPRQAFERIMNTHFIEA